jgi:hypothetical protein
MLFYRNAKPLRRAIHNAGSVLPSGQHRHGARRSLKAQNCSSFAKICAAATKHRANFFTALARSKRLCYYILVVNFLFSMPAVLFGRTGQHAKGV